MISESNKSFFIPFLIKHNPCRRIMLLNILGYRSAFLFKYYLEHGWGNLHLYNQIILAEQQNNFVHCRMWWRANVVQRQFALSHFCLIFWIQKLRVGTSTSQPYGMLQRNIREALTGKLWGRICWTCKKISYLSFFVFIFIFWFKGYVYIRTSISFQTK